MVPSRACKPGTRPPYEMGRLGVPSGSCLQNDVRGTEPAAGMHCNPESRCPSKIVYHTCKARASQVLLDSILQTPPPLSAQANLDQDCGDAAATQPPVYERYDRHGRGQIGSRILFQEKKRKKKSLKSLKPSKTAPPTFKGVTWVKKEEGTGGVIHDGSASCSSGARQTRLFGGTRRTKLLITP